MSRAVYALRASDGHQRELGSNARLARAECVRYARALGTTCVRVTLYRDGVALAAWRWSSEGAGACIEVIP